jgi:hypothetical protein
MQKIASNGATITNEFTEGNATLSIPATVVSGDWLNSVQRELVKVVEGVGNTLNAAGPADVGDQVFTAIKKLIQQGGQAAAISFAIANNQASAADVTGFPNIDHAVVRAFEAFIAILRRTDSGYVKQTGRLYGTWDTETSSWDLSIVGVHDSSGVDFSMLNVSGTVEKLQYVSDNMAGSSYAGTLKVSDIKFNLV